MSLRSRLYEIVFEADTKKGKIFDIVLIILILLSILFVMLDSVPSIHAEHLDKLRTAEWIVTIIFTLEYILRLIVVQKPYKYIFSFFGIVDFLSILPTYLALFIGGAQGLMVIRAIRLLRIFRVLKITRYLNESKVLMSALKASRVKISVFLFAVILVVIIIGTIMYLVEGEKSGFTSIPRSIYWAIVTLTTVGYGDITPITPLGQFLSAIVMILGYGIIAVPTGIVSVELSHAYSRKKESAQVCSNCMKEGHDTDARYCKYCGQDLETN